VEATDTQSGERRQPAGETLSVIICSYTLERWDDLARAVESAQRQTLAAHEVIVVIDGDDDLKRLADERLTAASVLSNTHPPGLSGARQTGADHATGAILVFLDDDAIADDDWLEQLLVAYEDPNVLGVGGLIEPLWREPAPRWFPAEFNWVVGCTYAGMPVKTTRIRNAIGANMSVWASVLASAGAFDSRLGRTDGRKGLYGTAEETEFGIRTTAAHPGRYWVYRPEARVRHSVPPTRGTWRYFVARCRVEGRAKAVLAAVAGAGDGLESERVYARSVLPRAVARGLVETLRGDPGGVERAAAIVIGLGVTTLAYATTRLAAIRPGRRR
jgi:glycosyltransferase involved in cell wall biosynthesis